MKKYVRNIYLILFFGFLYIPIVILVLFSFNKDRINSVWSGFTVDWYIKLFSNSEILTALQNSLIIALFSAVISVFAGTIISYVLYKTNFPGKKKIESILQLPIIMPDIITGIGLLSIYVLINFTLGRFSILLAHVFFNIAFAILIISTRFENFHDELIDAAKVLGANQTRIFFKIVMPLILPGIIAAFLITFTLSWDDFIIAFFTNGPGGTTLPIKVYSMIKFGVDPQINGISTITMILSFILIIIALKLQKNRRY